MKISKKVVTELTYPYSVSIFNCNEGKRVFVATESSDRCVMFDTEGKDIKSVWENNGGTMALWPLNNKPDFLAVQEFFKGFNSHNACIAKVLRSADGSFSTERYIDLPFVHRFCVVNILDEQFVIAATLCESKEFKEDWSKPGMVYIGRLPKNLSQRCILKPLIKNISKNHGMYIGKHNKKNVVMVAGTEGIFEIQLPETADGKWEYEKIFNSEVSDMSVFDIDDDGKEELITIEKFHGDNMVIYKYINGEYKAVYRYPISFGHVIWSGNIFGKASIILGYRGANGAILMFRKKPGRDFYMDITLIDEHEAPTNIDVLQEEHVFKIFSSCGGSGRVVLYELRED